MQKVGTSAKVCELKQRKKARERRKSDCRAYDPDGSMSSSISNHVHRRSRRSLFLLSWLASRKAGADPPDPHRVITMTAATEVSPLPNPIAFFMLGDFGGGPGTLHAGGNLQWKLDVAKRMGELAEELRPRFVVGLGDNFYDVGVETVEDPAWEDQFETVYSAAALREIPWLMCLGNHDYMGRPEAQIERTDYDATGRWQMPSRAYSRLFAEGSASVEIFSIDTSAISYTLTPETAGACAFAEPLPGCSPRFEEESLRVVDELRRLLDASTATWKIVAGHHPLFSSGHHGSARETAPLRTALLPLLDNYNVDLYACGHDHIAQHVVPTDSNKMAISTASGPGPEDAAGHGGDGQDGWRRRPSVRASGAAAVPAAMRTDHVSIGTSGPMVMPGEYDFRFERDNNGGGYDNFTTVGGHEGREVQGDDAHGSSGSRPLDGAVGDALEDSSSSTPGFDLWFATKRRAFGVVEASEEVLRFTLVGKAGDVLYSFDRRR